MSQTEFDVHARAVVPREAFDGLNVESALDGAEEGVVSEGEKEVEIKIYRSIRAEDESDARSKAHDGKLLTDVPHSVIEVLSVRNLDAGL